MSFSGSNLTGLDASVLTGAESVLTAATAPSTGGGGAITQVTSLDGSIIVGSPTGPVVNLEVATAVAPTLSLPASLTNAICVGDSTTLGSLDNQSSVANPGAPVPNWAASNNGSGGYRIGLWLALATQGIVTPGPTPDKWLTGPFAATMRNLAPTNPGAGAGPSWLTHAGVAGDTCALIAARWATTLATYPAACALLSCGINDLNNYLIAHPGDFAGAAAAANTAFVSLLAVIKAATPGIIIAVSSVPAGTAIAAAADLWLPILKATIATAAAGGQKIYLACDATSVVRGGYMADTLHPGCWGYQLWGGLWAQGLLACPY